MKTMYIGKEGSGKTLLMGRETERLIYRNHNLFRKTGVPRDIVSNIAYSDELLQFAQEMGVTIRKWQHIAELERMQEVDLFIDEVGAYFDSRTFEYLPLSTRLWLAQAQKLGVHIIGGAQDWAQIDVSFRRLVNRIYEVKKLVGTRRPSKTLPAGKLRFALSLKWRLAPNANSDLADVKPVSLLPMLVFMRPKDMKRFDTNSRVLETAPPPLKKIVQECPEDGYRRVRYI